MATKTETKHTAAFLVSEANGTLSREKITVVSGQNLEAGTVVGKITASGKYRILQPGGGDGSQTAAGVLYAAVDASGGDKAGVIIARDAEVNKNELVWPAGISDPEKVTALGQLATINIHAR